MISTIILSILGVIGILYLCLLAVEHVKKILTTNTLAINKATDDGESVTLSCNFYAFENQAQRAQKQAELHQLGDDRMAFVFNRMQERLRSEREKKQSGVQAIK